MHTSTRSLPDLRAWSRLIPVNTKNFRYSPATILLNSLLKYKGGSESGIDQTGGMAKCRGWGGFQHAGNFPGDMKAGLWEACWGQSPHVPESHETHRGYPQIQWECSAWGS